MPKFLPTILILAFTSFAFAADSEELLLLKRQNSALKFELARKAISEGMQAQQAALTEFNAITEELKKLGYTIDQQNNLIPPKKPDQKPAEEKKQTPAQK